MVEPSWFQLRHELLQSLVDVFRRESLIATAPDGDRRVISKTDYFFPCIRHVGSEIRGIRSVAGIGLEELVPEHDAVFVAEFIEVLARALTDPVADDGIICITVHADLGLQSFSGDALHRLVHPPVAPLADDGNPVDRKGEVVVSGQGVSNLANANIKFLLIGGGSPLNEAQSDGIKVLRTIPIGPPKLWILQVQLRGAHGIEGD